MLAYADFKEIRRLPDVGKMFLVGVIFQFIIPAIIFFAVLQIPGVIYK